MRFALAGNQNSGKTTLFNLLTGSAQHVGNWAGVTVEKKEGRVLRRRDVLLTDLPGIYSLSPYTAEEIISRDYLVSSEVDGIINIVDATNLERNLYLSMQLVELGRPMVIALNMMDEVRASGDVFDLSLLEEKLGLPVIPISARKREGIERLVSAAMDAVQKNRIPSVRDICEGPLHESLHSIGHLVESRAAAHGYTIRFAATKLMENDELMEQKLELSREERHIVGEIAALMEARSGVERDAALADARYTYIEKIVSQTVRRTRARGAPTPSDKIDRVLTHRIWALPCFLGIMLLVFGVTFGPLGVFLSDGFADLLGFGVEAVAGTLERLGVSTWVVGFVADGALGGVAAMLGFLPVILLLFLFLSILEDTGYMARAAFVMDMFFRRFGLSGQSFFPMVMGFGCSVPAVMAARTLRDPKQRRLTIFLVPFMSCGARVPIYAMFIAAFFSRYAALVMMGIYAFGILTAFVCAYFLKDVKAFKAESSPFVMELPPYRLPTVKTVLRLLWDKGSDFVRRAFTVIFVASMIIWFLSSFDFQIRFTEDSAQSILAVLGGWVAPLFAPLGFGTWQASTAVLAGFTAKEAVVSTMAVLYDTGRDLLPEVLRGVFSTASVLSFLVFSSLYMPCVAAFAAMRRELGTKWSLLAVGFETGVAWVLGFLVYQTARLITGG